MKRFYSIIIAALAAGIAGCATVPDSIVQQPPTARPQQAAPVVPANGAIFQSAGYRPIFEDRRARMVGDIVTITINERTSAGKSTATSGSKSSEVDFST
ncbi:MAG: flagellar basal body L-ring protein FlgH, partial [Noviherbaspirillum sp.]